MEGTAVTSLCLNPHNPLFRSTANNITEVPLSHPCVKTMITDLVFPPKAPFLTSICIRYGPRIHNIFDVFLDFKEKIPHNSSQINPYDD